MARASDLTQQIMRIIQDKGKGKKTGPGLFDVIAAAKEPDKLGRKRDAARLDIRSRKSRPGLEENNLHTLVIRDGPGAPKGTGIVLREGMEFADVELAGEIALDDHVKKKTDEFLEERSDADVDIMAIYDKFVERHRLTSPANTTRKREQARPHLASFFPGRLGDLLYESGLLYIDHHAASAQDADKLRTLTNSAIQHLKILEESLAFHYNSLSKPPAVRRYFLIPLHKKYRSEIFLTCDLFERLNIAARDHLVWDMERNAWKPDPVVEPDLEIVERYNELYFWTGTRDQTIVPLEWGVGRAAGSIDARNGIIYRSPPGASETNKRVEPSKMFPPMAKMAAEWERADQLIRCPYVLHDENGDPIHDMTSRFDRVCRKAGLPWVNKHVLKHTGTTILTHAGVDIVSLAGAYCTTPETLANEYRHLNFLWVNARTSLQRKLKLEWKDLKRLSPESSEAWRARAERVAARAARSAERRRQKKEKANGP